MSIVNDSENGIYHDPSSSQQLLNTDNTWQQPQQFNSALTLKNGGDGQSPYGVMVECNSTNGPFFVLYTDGHMQVGLQGASFPVASYGNSWIQLTHGPFTLYSPLTAAVGLVVSAGQLSDLYGPLTVHGGSLLTVNPLLPPTGLTAQLVSGTTPGSNLTPSTAYNYALTVVTQNNLETNATPAVSVTQGTVALNVQLTWAAPDTNAQYVNVYRNGLLLAHLAGTSTGYVDNGSVAPTSQVPPTVNVTGVATFNNGLTGSGTLGNLQAGPGLLNNGNTWNGFQNFTGNVGFANNETFFGYWQTYDSGIRYVNAGVNNGGFVLCYYDTSGVTYGYAEGGNLTANSLGTGGLTVTQTGTFTVGLTGSGTLGTLQAGPGLLNTVNNWEATQVFTNGINLGESYCNVQKGYDNISLMFETVAQWQYYSPISGHGFVYTINNDGSRNSLMGYDLTPPTSGTVRWIQPEQGVNKYFIAAFQGYVNTGTGTQSINFPTAFTIANSVTTNTTGIALTASLTALQIPATNSTTPYTGVVEVVGI